MATEDGGDDQKEVDTSNLMNPKELDGVPDLSMLVYMEMAHVLHNLEYRYQKMDQKQIYTSISTVLVAINPYERLPIYTEEIREEYHQAALKFRTLKGRPHPYGVAARCYTRMISHELNQSALCCGESGAGKTETAKQLIRYLTLTSPSAMEGAESVIEQQIMAASPIMEAFGNAKTCLNNNSSRFGKFTKLLYSVQRRVGTILGSSVEVYLLEKIRVVKQAKDERNFHSFYFMHKGLDDDQISGHLDIKDLMSFSYVKQGGQETAPGVIDRARFDELRESLTVMGVSKEDQQNIWDILGGILHLGNIAFKSNDAQEAEIDPKCQKHLENVAKLWGIEPEAVAKRLTTANMKVMKKNIEKKIGYDKAEPNRDAIAKNLYNAVFLNLVSRINDALFVALPDDKDSDGEDEEAAKSRFIGILDVFGFENFDINSLEQFCINFCNERLQQYFNIHIIRSEQEEYMRESVFWTPLDVPDSSDLITLVEKKGKGLYACLDSACIMPKATDENFLQELFKNWKGNAKVEESKNPGKVGISAPKKKKKSRKKGRYRGIIIHHFADDVNYDTSKFLQKNMDAQHDDTIKMFGKSASAYIQLCGANGGIPGKKKKKKKKNFSSTTSVFNKQISGLMKELTKTDPYFVRCVNPNRQKSKEIFDQRIVEHQLRCGGLLEALRVLKLGYPTRVPYDTLYENYHSAIDSPMVKNLNPSGFSEAVLIAFGVTKADYELGLTKIFFKPAKAAILDEIMEAAGKPLSAEQNKRIHDWIIGKRIRTITGTLKMFVKFQYHLKIARAYSKWRKAGRVAAVLASSLVRNLLEIREEILRRKQKEACIQWQKKWRTILQMRKLKKKLKRVKKASKVLWRSDRRMRERYQLAQWLCKSVVATRANQRKEEQVSRDEERAKRLERASEVHVQLCGGLQDQLEDHKQTLEQLRMLEIESDCDKIREGAKAAKVLPGKLSKLQKSELDNIVKRGGGLKQAGADADEIDSRVGDLKQLFADINEDASDIVRKLDERLNRLRLDDMDQQHAKLCKELAIKVDEEQEKIAQFEPLKSAGREKLDELNKAIPESKTIVVGLMRARDDIMRKMKKLTKELKGEGYGTLDATLKREADLQESVKAVLECNITQELEANLQKIKDQIKHEENDKLAQLAAADRAAEEARIAEEKARQEKLRREEEERQEAMRKQQEEEARLKREAEAAAEAERKRIEEERLQKEEDEERRRKEEEERKAREAEEAREAKLREREEEIEKQRQQYEADREAELKKQQEEAARQQAEMLRKQEEAMAKMREEFAKQVKFAPPAGGGGQGERPPDDQVVEQLKWDLKKAKTDNNFQKCMSLKKKLEAYQDDTKASKLDELNNKLLEAKKTDDFEACMSIQGEIDALVKGADKPAATGPLKTRRKSRMPNVPPTIEFTDSDITDVDEDEESEEEEEGQKEFLVTANQGQLFLKHTGKKRRKPQDRFVKINLNPDQSPREISWGSGSRHINFDDIKFVAWGHWTPVWQTRKDIDPALCFSVVGSMTTLDLEAEDERQAQFWVEGLRDLIGQQDDEADRMAHEYLENYRRQQKTKKKKRKKQETTSGGGADGKKGGGTGNHEERTKSLMQLQMDLFIMTTTTVFRNLEEEGTYKITPDIRKLFPPQQMYEEALSKDIPWRQWNAWLRSKIVTFLRQTQGQAQSAGATPAATAPPPTGQNPGRAAARQKSKGKSRRGQAAPGQDGKGGKGKDKNCSNQIM